MRLPQSPVRWVLTLLFLTLVGLTAWIVWAMGKLEEKREAIKAKEAEKARMEAGETPNSNRSSSKE